MAKAPARTGTAFQLPLIPPESDWRAPTEFLSLRGCRRAAIDVETKDRDLKRLGPGVRRAGNYIVGIGVGTDDGRRAYYPIRHEGGGNMDQARVLAWAVDELNAFDGEVCGFGIGYDIDWLAQVGVTFPNAGRHTGVRFRDAQVAEALLDENRIDYSMDAISQDRLGIGKEEDLIVKYAIACGLGSSNDAVKENIWRYPARIVGPYGEGDVDRPLRLLTIQEPLIDAEGMRDLWEVESKLTPILVDARRRGVRVAIDRADEVRATLARERDRHAEEFRRVIGTRTAEINRPDSFVAALRARGLHVGFTAKSGQPQIDKGFLESNRHDEAVIHLAAARRVDTLINTFIDGHILEHGSTGRIHATFNQTKRDKEGTTGGGTKGTIARLSSDTPNLQNVPSRESLFDEVIDFGDDVDVVKLIRGLFLPEEDEDWERHDASQIEYRLLAHYGRGPGSEAVRERYRSDPRTDFHKMAAGFLGVDPEDAKKRKRVKNVNFAKVYNSGLETIAATFACSLEEAKDFVEKYDREMPWVKDTNRAAMNAASRFGKVHTVLHRVAHFDRWEPKDWDLRREIPHRRGLPRSVAEKQFPAAVLQRAFTHAALNRVLQGSCADVVKKALVDTHAAGVTRVLGPILVTVHDENGWSKPRTREGDEAVAEAKRIFETAVPLRVPVLVEADRGADWGECS